MTALVKTFKNRSSATDVLRAIGINARDYNLFIEPVTADGGNTMFACKIDLAKSHVGAVEVQKSAPKKKATKSKLVAAKEAGILTIAETNDAPIERGPWPFPKSPTPVKTEEPPVERIDAGARAMQAIQETLHPTNVRATGRNGSTVNVPKEVARQAGLHIHKNSSFPTAPKISKDAHKQAQKKAAKGQPVMKSVKEPKEKKATVSSRAREMIIAGASSDEVWKMMQDEFGLGDDKKSYPNWYRRECVKKGLIKE